MVEQISKIEDVKKLVETNVSDSRGHIGRAVLAGKSNARGVCSYTSIRGSCRRAGPNGDRLSRKYEVLREDWEFLATMFRRTGKLVWLGAKPGDYSISQWIGLEEQGKPKWLTKQPVLELR